METPTLQKEYFETNERETEDLYDKLMEMAGWKDMTNSWRWRGGRRMRMT
jgi:hypothetical protein